MKANVLLDRLLEKLDVPEKQMYKEAIEKTKFDLPDEFAPLVNGIDNLFDENAAKQKASLADHFNKRFEQNHSQAMVAEMKGLGFNDTEIDEVLKMPFEKRFGAISKKAIEKELSKVSLSENERVRAAEEQARREKERADLLQARSIEELSRLERKHEESRAEELLTRLVQKQQIDTKMPAEDAYEMIMSKVKRKMQNANIQLINSGNGYRLVNKDDPALDYYDERHNRVSIDQVIESCIRELNMAPAARRVDQTKKVTINSGAQINMNSTQSFLKNFINNALS